MRRIATRTGSVVGAGALALLLTLPVQGQMTPPEMTLDEAIRLAKANNPTFLSTQNDQSAANWQVREAYAQFLPSVNASLGGTWQEAGAQRFGAFVFEDQLTDWFYSGYGINLGMTIDGNTIFGIPNARANRRATEARVTAAEFNLESTVAFQYMAVLRAQDGLDVADRQLERARQNLDIVGTRVSSGAAAGTDGRQAEVDLGRAEVTLIQARRDLRQARLMLAEQLGVQIDEETELVSSFEVFQPMFNPDELLRWMVSDNPSLVSFRAQESASRAAARQMSTSQYLPTLNLSASFRGQAQEALNRDFVTAQLHDRASALEGNCLTTNAIHNGIAGGLPGYTPQNCGGFAVTPQMEADALAANNAFPFSFTTIPATISATFSIPVFTGFSRQRQVAQANDVAEDAEHSRRAEELRLRTLVTNTYDNLASAYEVVQAESRNLTLAEEQLQLQQRRYALGAVDLLLLMDAQTSLSTAEQSYLNAVYDFHYNLIALESAVGSPLRPR